MKNLTLGFVYVGTWMLGFFVLSLVGMLWFPYSTVISEPIWFMMYSLLIGWWIGIPVTIEVDENWNKS